MLHTLCTQLAATLDAARAEHDRAENPIFAEVSDGADGHVQAYGEIWTTLQMKHRWALTRLYAETALSYAANASQCAAARRVGQLPMRFVNCPHGADDEGPGGAWLLAGLAQRLPRLQLPDP